MAKGMSIEEKRKNMLDIFYESKDFFPLKEIEKIAPRKKGIIYQSVKDVLTSLVDDNLVRQEKIGCTNFFWSFPSQRKIQRLNAIAKLSEEKQSLIANLEAQKAKLEEEQSLRIDENRKTLIEKYEELEIAKSRLDENLAKYSYCDPDRYEEMKFASSNLKEEINLLTDNIFTIQSYVCSKFGIDNREFCRNFGIEETLDYID